jgi:protein-L-isoaspartate(D-aspartate) O-methyltransferase
MKQATIGSPVRVQRREEDHNQVSQPDLHRNQRMEFQLGLRRRGITDKAVLRAMDEVPREEFVEAEYAADAYADTALPIACGQTISQPFVVAYMTEKLEVGGGPQRVLEIGTGSGYQAAVLAHLAGQVVSLERFPRLAEQARRRLAGLGLTNAEVVVADGLDVPLELGDFDRIIVTAAMAELPPSLKQRLRAGGILIAPVGPQHGVQTLVRVRATDSGFEDEELISVRFVPALPGLGRT